MHVAFERAAAALARRRAGALLSFDRREGAANAQHSEEPTAKSLLLLLCT